MTVSNTSLQVLAAEDVVARFRSMRSGQPVQYFAFYSSQLGGVVTDPALMVLPFDDHIVHRGHGIFDTAGLVNGKIYDLEAHLDRFLLSAERSRLRLPCAREEMRDIIIKTTAVSGQREGSIRYWISSGPGSLELTPAAGSEPGFFVMIFGGLAYPDRWLTKGARVMTTTYPIKAPIYAITKATNYLPNVLMQMEAKEAGFDNGVFLDAEGYVGESSNMNVAFVTRDGVLAHPKFDHVLAGCTSLRILELATTLQEQGLLKAIEVRDVTVAEAHASREMLLARQLGESGADRPMGRTDDWRRQAWTGLGRAAEAPGRRHAHERSVDRRALLTRRYLSGRHDQRPYDAVLTRIRKRVCARRQLPATAEDDTQRHPGVTALAATCEPPFDMLLRGARLSECRVRTDAERSSRACR